MREKVIKRIRSTIMLFAFAVLSATSATTTAATVDLLILYDNYSRNYFSGDPQTAMQGWVNQMNGFYQTSQVDITLRLVGVRANEGTGSTMRDILYDIRDDNNIIALRDQLGADFVAQVHQTGSCGIGFVAVNKNYTWSVNGPQCGPATMIHELGHNMGLRHSRRQGDTTGTRYRYGLGHGVDNRFATLMAYPSVFSASRFGTFSNPNLTCDGLPCGVPVGQSEEAHASLALQNVRNEVAAFRPTAGGSSSGGSSSGGSSSGGSSSGGSSSSSGGGSCSGLPVWSSSQVYTGGNEVQYQGVKYRAKWWTQGENPSQSGQWGVWENLGSCGGSSSSSGGSSSGGSSSGGSSSGGSSSGGSSSSSGGGCAGIPQYVDGNSYNTGDQVQNVGNKYQCTVGGWCTVGGPYEPGVGWAWTNAWNQLGGC